MAKKIFNAQLFWYNLDKKNARSLFSRINYINSSFFASLSSLTGIDKGGYRQMLDMVLDGKSPGTRQADEFYSLSRAFTDYYHKVCRGRDKNDPEPDAETLAAKGFGEEKYKLMLKQFSEFLAFVYECIVPEDVKEVYKTIEESPEELQMTMDIEKLSEADLADNPTPRFQLIIIIDNAFYMDGCAFGQLNASLQNLINEIEKNSLLSSAVELYIATSGHSRKEKEENAIKEIVSFATIDRQRKILHEFTIKPYGLCYLGTVINMALDKLEKRKALMVAPDNSVSYYPSWMILLTNGKYIDEPEMEIACDRMNEMKRQRELQVYPVGITEKAIMDNLCKLDGERAAILTSFKGFFNDVFQSMKMIKNSTPGGDRIELVHNEGFR